MKSILDKIFNDYIKENDFSKSVDLLESEIEKNKRRLKLKFSREQKILLLRIIDAKDSIIENCSKASFIAGFKIGLQIGYESNKD